MSDCDCGDCDCGDCDCGDCDCDCGDCDCCDGCCDDGTCNSLLKCFNICAWFSNCTDCCLHMYCLGCCEPPPPPPPPVPQEVLDRRQREAEQLPNHLGMDLEPQVGASAPFMEQPTFGEKFTPIVSSPVEDLPPSYDEAVKQSSAVAQQEVADKSLDAALAKLQKT